jgi:hypothetical protein
MARSSRAMDVSVQGRARRGMPQGRIGPTSPIAAELGRHGYTLHGASPRSAGRSCGRRPRQPDPAHMRTCIQRRRLRRPSSKRCQISPKRFGRDAGSSQRRRRRSPRLPGVRAAAHARATSRRSRSSLVPTTRAVGTAEPTIVTRTAAAADPAHGPPGLSRRHVAGATPGARSTDGSGGNGLPLL